MKPKKFFWKKLFSLILIMGVFFIPNQTLSSSQVKTPNLLKAEINSENKLLLEGLTVLNTDILIYLNGSFVNLANIKEIYKENVNSFSYLSSFELSPGKHSVSVIAKDKNSGTLSPPLDHTISVFDKKTKIENNFLVPAPILTEPSSEKITNIRPKISGLAANGTYVKFYLNGLLIGKTEFIHNYSGTGSFVFVPKQNLKKGSYRLWAIAVDSNNKESEKSNIINFSISTPEVLEKDPSKEEELESEKTIIKTPIILKPEKNSLVYASDLLIVGKIDQLVDFINIYINNSLEKTLVPEIKNNQSSVINHSFSSLAPGEYSLHLTAQKNNLIGPKSEIINFTIVKDPEEVKEVRGNKEENEAENDVLATSSKEKEEALDQSIASFIKENEKYFIFGLLLLMISAWLIWSNKEVINKKIKK